MPRKDVPQTPVALLPERTMKTKSSHLNTPLSICNITNNDIIIIPAPHQSHQHTHVDTHIYRPKPTENTTSPPRAPTKTPPQIIVTSNDKWDVYPFNHSPCPVPQTRHSSLHRQQQQHQRQRRSIRASRQTDAPSHTSTTTCRSPARILLQPGGTASISIVRQYEPAATPVVRSAHKRLWKQFVMCRAILERH
jgi:hypothetical protein